MEPPNYSPPIRLAQSSSFTPSLICVTPALRATSRNLRSSPNLSSPFTRFVASLTYQTGRRATCTRKRASSLSASRCASSKSFSASSTRRLKRGGRRVVDMQVNILLPNLPMQQRAHDWKRREDEERRVTVRIVEGY